MDVDEMKRKLRELDEEVEDQLLQSILKKLDEMDEGRRKHFEWLLFECSKLRVIWYYIQCEEMCDEFQKVIQKLRNK